MNEQLLDTFRHINDAFIEVAGHALLVKGYVAAGDVEAMRESLKALSLHAHLLGDSATLAANEDAK